MSDQKLNDWSELKVTERHGSMRSCGSSVGSDSARDKSSRIKSEDKVFGLAAGGAHHHQAQAIGD